MLAALMSQTPTTTHTVGAEEEGMRLDRLVRKFYAKKPLAWVYGEIRRGNVRVNGKKKPQSYRLAGGDEITLPAPPEARAKKKPRGRWSGPVPTVIAEEEGWLAVNKPAGLLSQGGNEKSEPSLVDWLAREYPDADFTPAPAHRLDRETSGLILCAKKASAARALLDQFTEGSVRKEYLALVQGEMSQALVCEAPIASHREGNFTSQRVMEDGQEAATEIIPLASESGRSLVLAMPRTGRKHQIRVHLAHLGHPLLGDARYGGPDDAKLRIAGGIFLLHAWRLSFSDPTKSARRVRLEAPLPLPFRVALDVLKIDPDLSLQRARLAIDRRFAGA